MSDVPLAVGMIETVIRETVARTTASSGDDLTGFVMDLDHAIFQSGLSEDAEVIRSGDDLSMLNVSVVLPGSFGTLGQVKQAFAKVLMDVAYSRFHAGSFAFHRDAATLRFITAVPESGLRVTGTIIVVGPSYESVAARSGVAGTPFPGGLPSWSAG